VRSARVVIRGGPVCAPRSLPAQGARGQENERRRGVREKIERGISPLKGDFLNGEAFAAAAFTFHVRIAKTEGFVQTLLDEVHLGAINEPKTVSIYDDFDALIFEHHVLGFDVIGVIDHVRKTGAAGFLHPEAQAQAMSPAGEEIADTIGSGVGE
jgi:hypothetical protein